ncbi:biotin--[acetyl-CoA-carboxylase] ligase [Nakamurella flavida]|uniref:biotin--[biotin carboxyl-carrier protein] ligase n=1 Tax=Nakamurella flavida TaxID=363630 RepID=A0A938YIT5_9ACTN|nr:biotin--[acetyl-CoA-carboxylase] ligase [Nakamurella flavida]MBM9478475.1 biotin--[acetyl-CoA-carboxylase] ligase [Nakamurella flavida]MDP9777699.1 BirA family biotin operon repressor/biotin-[acetyl-CoA-carboxylase] ligase [Nakamurella flavida]
MSVDRSAPSVPSARADARAPISAADVRARVADPTRWDIGHVISTGSTNADLMDTPAPPSGAVAVLIAEEQIRGRGRAGRVWSCPAGAGLMMSIALHRPPVPPARRGWAGAVLGLALVDALAALLPGRDVGLKWPNDVLVDGDKIAGILGEAGAETVVVGSGVNITLRADELPRPDATSLALLGAVGPAFDRAALAAAVLDGLSARLDRWFVADGDVDAGGLRADYRDRSATLGRSVRLQIPGGAEVLGVATDITPDGALVVRTTDGRERAWSVAEVTHLRPAT